jgi:hypothetical protein
VNISGPTIVPRKNANNLSLAESTSGCASAWPKRRTDPAGSASAAAAQHFPQVVGQPNRERDDREGRVGDPSRRKYRGPCDIKVVERMQLEVRVDYPLRGVTRHTRGPDVVPIDDQLPLNIIPRIEVHIAIKVVHSRLQ